MASCKECIHFDRCKGLYKFDRLQKAVSKGCSYFKDRSRFVELPCMVGDTLYTIVIGSRIREWIVTDIAFSSYSIVKMVITADSKDKNGTDHMRFGEHYFNHTVFLNREEAERALKEFEP